MSSPSIVIFFDGASKGIPRISRAGGLVISPNRLIESSFSWGLGIMSNNHDESYSFLKVCHISKENGYKAIQIFGDSELLIKVLNSEDHFNNFALNKYLRRIHNILKEFERVASFHILRELNKIADALANKACLLSQGNLSINGESSKFYPIP